MCNSHDTYGRPWAKLSEVKAGDWLRSDAGFDCLSTEAEVEVQQHPTGLFVVCSEGMHFIEGQADDGEHLVGFYSVEHQK